MCVVFLPARVQDSVHYMTCTLMGMYVLVYMYRICPNRSPGVYFLPESFYSATTQAWLLFEPQRLLTVRLGLCHTEHYLQYKMYTQQVGSSHGTVEKESIIRGHHVYKAIWTAVIGEKLLTQDLPYI